MQSFIKFGPVGSEKYVPDKRTHKRILLLGLFNRIHIFRFYLRHLKLFYSVGSWSLGWMGKAWPARQTALGTMVSSTTRQTPKESSIFCWYCLTCNRLISASLPIDRLPKSFSLLMAFAGAQVEASIIYIHMNMEDDIWQHEKTRTESKSHYAYYHLWDRHPHRFKFGHNVG